MQTSKGTQNPRDSQLWKEQHLTLGSLWGIDTELSGVHHHHKVFHILIMAVLASLRVWNCLDCNSFSQCSQHPVVTALQTDYTNATMWYAVISEISWWLMLCDVLCSAVPPWEYHANQKCCLWRVIDVDRRENLTFLLRTIGRTCYHVKLMSLVFFFFPSRCSHILIAGKQQKEGRETLWEAQCNLLNIVSNTVWMSFFFSLAQAQTVAGKDWYCFVVSHPRDKQTGQQLLVFIFQLFTS